MNIAVTGINFVRQAEVAGRLRRLLSADAVLHAEEDTRSYECDGLSAYRQLPMVVALPSNEEEVHQVLRVRAVTVEGEVVEFGSEALDSPGLDLLALMIGSEGMLAVATEITVKLLPKPETARVILASFDDVEKAGNAVADVVAAGVVPSGLEMMDRPAARAVEEFVHAGYDLEAAALLLCETG